MLIWSIFFLAMRLFNNFLLERYQNPRMGWWSPWTLEEWPESNWGKVCQGLYESWVILTTRVIQLNEMHHTSCRGSPSWGLLMLFMLGPKQCWTQPSCQHIFTSLQRLSYDAKVNASIWLPKCRNVTMYWDVHQPIYKSQWVSTSQNQNMSEIHILHDFSHSPNTWLIKRPADSCTSTSWDCGISPTFGICWNWQIDEFLLNAIADVDDTCLIRLVHNAMPRYNKHGLNDKWI